MSLRYVTRKLESQSLKERGDGEGVKEELPIYQVRSNICFWFERKIWLCQGLVSNNQIRMSWLKKKIALTQAHWRHKEKIDSHLTRLLMQRTNI